MRDTAAIILAAGFSRRMGVQKLLLPINGVPLLQRTLDVISGFPFKNVILVSTLIVANCVKTHAQIVINPAPELGQSSSMRLGIQGANPGDSLFFFTGDQPLLDAETLSAILAADDEDSIVFPKTTQGIAKNPTLFAPRFRDELCAVTGDMGGREVRNRHPGACRPVTVADERVLLDVDTVEDYEKVLRILDGKEG